MSASDPDSKIDFLDPPDTIRKKIKKAFCEEGNIVDNGILAFISTVLIPISQLRLERNRGVDGEEVRKATANQLPFAGEGAPEGTVFSVERPDKFGGSLHYTNYEDIEKDFAEKNLHPGDLKKAVAEGIVSLLVPIQDAFNKNEEWQRTLLAAYPENKPDAGKKKKVRFIALFRFVLFLILFP